jgi:hypothetical protein
MKAQRYLGRDRAERETRDGVKHNPQHNDLEIIPIAPQASPSFLSINNIF